MGIHLLMYLSFKIGNRSMRELSWANKPKLIAVATTQVSRFFSNDASKMKWRDGYDCNNFIGGNCNSASKRFTIGGNCNSFTMCRNWCSDSVLQYRVV